MQASDINVVEVAAEIHRQVTSREKNTGFCAGLNPSIEQAYDTQDAYVELLSGSGAGDVVGYKIALTSPAMQQMCGVDHPLAGKLLSSAVHEIGSQRTYALALKDHQRVGVEFEVAVKLGAPLKGRVDRATVASAVSAVIPAFELVEDRHADYDSLQAFSLIAENAWNAGNILGDPVIDFAGINLETAATRLAVNGEIVGEAVTGDAMGHPFDVVAWISQMLDARSEQLHAGQIVMTGSSITTRFPQTGDHYQFDIAGVGGVSLQVT